MSHNYRYGIQLNKSRLCVIIDRREEAVETAADDMRIENNNESNSEDNVSENTSMVYSTATNVPGFAGHGILYGNHPFDGSV